jgi:PD-(D/E)XK endonuclease
LLPKMRVNGAIAEYRIVADLIKRGYTPFSPLLENTECDLVVDVNGDLLKIQIKSSSSDGDKIKVDLTRPSSKNQYYSKEDFDILAIYDHTTEKVAYINWSDLPHKRSVTLRFTDTENSNGFVGKHGRKYFNDYLEFPIPSRKEATA